MLHFLKFPLFGIIPLVSVTGMNLDFIHAKIIEKMQTETTERKRQENAN
jgi:hypothetical protein